MKARPIQRVEDLTEPAIVGRTYLVPTITHEWYGEVLEWPVMGPKHDDLEHLKFAPQHYHIDIRFVVGPTRRTMLKMTRDRSPFDDDNGTLGYAAAGAPVQAYERAPLPSIIERPLKCRREPCYPLDWVQGAERFAKLFADYEGGRCARNADGVLICPHKGAPLGSLSPNSKGHVVCPLHGLVIDTSTCVVVKHEVVP